MRRVLPVIFALFFAATTVAIANDFLVTNTNDSGAGSLREAILEANAIGGLDTIAFNIPFSPAGFTIRPTSDLPTIDDPVVIDGYTQPGASANTLANGDNAVLLIGIDGADDSNVAAGLTITVGGAGSVIRGLGIIHVGKGAAITLSETNNCVIEGCFIGTDGTMARPNHHGGIFTAGGSGNLVGGTTPAARNIISGNNGDAGIEIRDNNDVVQGNFIGVNATGTNALPNAGSGVVMIWQGSGNRIGGTSAADRNIISGNGQNGIFAELNVFGNIIQGNFIGTDVTGTRPLGNTAAGLFLDGFDSGSSGNNLIGGTAPGAGNVISTNGGAGIRLSFESNDMVQGNFIGTDVTGSQALGNTGAGIYLFQTSQTTIGGEVAGAGNIIAYNSDGVVASTAHSPILGNSIFGNSQLGIDHVGFTGAGAGPTLNDPGDADTGSNDLQNFPVLTSVNNSAGMTTISGRLNSAPNTSYRIEFFANDDIDPTGYGEGQTFINFKEVTTNASGNAFFSATFPQIGARKRVTSTATDPNNNTSEFSGAIGQLLNASTRMQVQTGNDVLIAGFIVSGSGSTEVLLRALGPALSQFGVSGVLANPTLDLFGGSTLLASNDDWKDTQEFIIGATGKHPPYDVESGILRTVTPANYTAVVRGKNNTTGVSLVEVYDIDKVPETTLTNISTRGLVGTGQNVMIGGLISGNGIVSVIVRALGPTLSQFGVTNVLADPTLELRDVAGNVIASNDNWKDSQQAEIQASGKAPPNNNESAIIIVSPPANTTAIVRGKNNTTGNALVEAYILTP